ncbi:MAG: hypothetical protein AB7T08_09855 [Hyphomonadaceae bacterium]
MFGPFREPRGHIDLVVFAVIELAFLAVRTRAITLKVLAMREQFARSATAVMIVRKRGDHGALARVRGEPLLQPSKLRARSAAFSLSKQLREFRPKRPASLRWRSSPLLDTAFEKVLRPLHLHAAIAGERVRAIERLQQR